MKKRLIVVSLYGAAADLGFMTIDEIEKFKIEVINENKLHKLEKIYPKVSDLDDIYLIVWRSEVN